MGSTKKYRGGRIEVGVIKLTGFLYLIPLTHTLSPRKRGRLIGFFPGGRGTLVVTLHGRESVLYCCALSHREKSN